MEMEQTDVFHRDIFKFDVMFPLIKKYYNISTIFKIKISQFSDQSKLQQ